MEEGRDYQVIKREDLTEEQSEESKRLNYVVGLTGFFVRRLRIGFPFIIRGVQRRWRKTLGEQGLGINLQ